MLENATKEKADNFKKEMKRMKINTLGMNKVTWQGAKTITSGKNILNIHSGGTEHELGVAIVLNHMMSKVKKNKRGHHYRKRKNPR